MTLVAATADLHIKDDPDGVTLAVQVDVLKRLADTALERQARRMLVAGDVFDWASTPAERNAAIEVFDHWASLMPVVVARGNHDREGDLDYLGRLQTRHPITVWSRFAMLRCPEAMYAIMPWPSRGRVASWLPEADRDKVTNAAQGAVRALLAGAQAMCGDEPLVFLGHLELGSAIADSGQPIAGHCDLPIATDDLLDLGAKAYILGHIHKPQTIAERIRYVGSPRQMNFGEEPGHGFTMVEVETGEHAHVHVDSPRFYTIDAAWKNGELVMATSGGNFETDHVRLRYTVPESERGAAREIAERIAATWKHCKLDPQVLTEDRVRCETIRTARTPEDKLRSYWEAKGTPPRAAEITAKLNALIA